MCIVLVPAYLPTESFVKKKEKEKKNPIPQAEKMIWLKPISHLTTLPPFRTLSEPYMHPSPPAVRSSK